MLIYLFTKSRIAAMYLLCGSAFVIYILKVPECLAPGAVDIFGHSHQGIMQRRL